MGNPVFKYTYLNKYCVLLKNVKKMSEKVLDPHIAQSHLASIMFIFFCNLYLKWFCVAHGHAIAIQEIEVIKTMPDLSLLIKICVKVKQI